MRFVNSHFWDSFLTMKFLNSHFWDFHSHNVNLPGIISNIIVRMRITKWELKTYIVRLEEYFASLKNETPTIFIFEIVSHNEISQISFSRDVTTIGYDPPLFQRPTIQWKICLFCLNSGYSRQLVVSRPATPRPGWMTPCCTSPRGLPI